MDTVASAVVGAKVNSLKEEVLGKPVDKEQERKRMSALQAEKAARVCLE